MREKSKKILSVLFFCLVIFWAFSAQAITWSVSNDPSLYGYLDQNTIPTIGSVACGPTSAVNSFVFLQDAYPSVYTTSLVPASSGVITNADMVAVAQILASATYMNTTVPNGTYWTNFLPAIEKYTEAKDPGVTVYNSSLLTGSSTAWQFIYQQLLLGSDLEILIQKTSSTSGANHFLKVDGLSWNDQTNRGTLSGVDPWTGSAYSSTIFYDSTSNRLDLSYAGLSWIYGGASERPSVAEPSAMLLLGFGLVGLVGFSRRKKFRK